MDKKNIFLYRIGLILIHMNQIFLMKSSEFEIPFQSKVMIKTPAENYRNCYVAKNRIIFELSKISLPIFNSTN